MSSFLTILIIGISLSMDAFSLALIYGMQGMSKRNKILLSLIVGIYHFIMPLIGLTFGTILDNINLMSIDIIASLILIYIGIDLIISNSKKEDRLEINKLGFIIFGLSVSIDSLTVGIGLKALTDNYLISSITFSLSSLIFTYTGLLLGNIIGSKVGKYSKLTGGIILICIAIIMFIR
ncbi:MAG: manganese efflux pump [Bacilli bacterium]|nr:manganese efflux pump [Bacilli bacterium]